MIARCCEWMLIMLGLVLLVAVLLPWMTILSVPEPYATEFISAKLLMLPLGAICLGVAAALTARLRHTR